jgi:hypothetical protein
MVGHNSASFSGYISDFQYYRGRAIGKTEAKWLYNHPGVVYSTDSLRCWLKFNEFTGDTCWDSSGNNNYGVRGAGVAANKPTWSIETP